MMRSMYSAVSSLKAHQLKMDVIGNNIANVNTVGFKGSRVTFQEVFNQTLKGAGSPQENGKGGTNPQQVGLGVSVSSMDTFHIRGAVETTGYNTDLMINGDGFFIVADDTNFLNRSYTRAGNFGLDQQGNLITPDGYRVLGYMADDDGKLKTNLEGIVISKALTTDAKKTDKVGMEGTLNSEVEKYAGDQDDIVGDDTNSVFVKKSIEKGGRTINIYELNKDYADCVAHETTYKVYDNLGGTHTIKQAFIKTDDSDNDNQYTVETFYIKEDGEMIHATAAPASGGQTTIEFDSNGKLTEDSKKNMNLIIGAELTNGAGEFTFEIDLSEIKMAANDSSVSAAEINGYKQGTLDDFAIAPTGEVTGVFSNGEMRTIGRIALANFKNPSGLEKTGSNLYQMTNNSGEPMVGTPGSGGFASLNPGSIEMSNVDLSREFTDMITTQRGFQANSRIITTSDEMLQEIVNMKR